MIPGTPIGWRNRRQLKDLQFPGSSNRPIANHSPPAVRGVGCSRVIASSLDHLPALRRCQVGGRSKLPGPCLVGTYSPGMLPGKSSTNGNGVCCWSQVGSSTGAHPYLSNRHKSLSYEILQPKESSNTGSRVAIRYIRHSPYLCGCSERS
jgi:hypothetical protein